LLARHARPHLSMDLLSTRLVQSCCCSNDQCRKP